MIAKLVKPKIIACWGESIEKRKYLLSNLLDIIKLANSSNATWHSIGPPLKSGHPRHPSRASLKLKMVPFEIEKYFIDFPQLLTIDELNIENYNLYDKNIYQTKLTNKLDKGIESINQNVLNEIILWKINRYSEFSQSTFKQLNSLKEINDRIGIIQLIVNLLDHNGIGLPMASTILRFINPNRFQIIDQRAYRIIYGRRLILPRQSKEQAELYLAYLEKLSAICKQKGIEFDKADRILYYIDKEFNKNNNLSNY